MEVVARLLDESSSVFTDSELIRNPCHTHNLMVKEVRSTVSNHGSQEVRGPVPPEMPGSAGLLRAHQKRDL